MDDFFNNLLLKYGAASQQGVLVQWEIVFLFFSVASLLCGIVTSFSLERKIIYFKDAIISNASKKEYVLVRLLSSIYIGLCFWLSQWLIILAIKTPIYHYYSGGVILTSLLINIICSDIWNVFLFKKNNLFSFKSQSILVGLLLVFSFLSVLSLYSLSLNYTIKYDHARIFVVLKEWIVALFIIISF